MQHTRVSVGLPVRSLPDAIGWYRTVLGSRRTWQPKPNILEFEVVQGFWLQLVEDRHREPGDSVLRFCVPDIGAEHSRLSKAGINVSEIRHPESPLAYFRVTDPYGNRLSLYQEKAG